ncbi:MAG TPA: winged helix-turn-helix domain-containing protein [Vicinamibacterales bacterium]
MLPAAHGSIVRFGDFAFDRGTRLLRRGDREIPLPPRVLGVLELLLDRAGDVVPRQAIIDSVWKDAFVTDTSLAEAISYLRQALGDDPQAPEYVQTVHRRGYRFVASVESPAEVAAPVLPAPVAAVPEVLKPSILGDLVPWAVATFCAIAALLAIWQLTHRDVAVPPVVRVRLDPPAGTALDTRGPAFALSPDGSALVLAACGPDGCRLYQRALNRLETDAIAGTDDGAAPFFSPDGRWIGFFANGKLKKVARSGGAPVILADAPQVFGAAWLPDNAIVFADSRFGGLKRVADAGGAAVPLTRPSAGEIGHAWPVALAGGRAVMFTVATSPQESASGRITLIPYERGGSQRTAQTLIDVADAARPMGDDYIVYSRRGELHAVPFDALRLAAAGDDRVIATGVASLQFAVSRSGALVYGGASDGQPATIWRQGSDAGLAIGDVAGAQPAALSPDGTRATVVSDEETVSDVWVKDLERGVATRITHGGTNVLPIWSADGNTVFYASRQGDAPFEIWRRDSGAETPAVRVVSQPGAHAFPTSVAAGTLVFTVAGQGVSIWRAPVSGGAASVLVDSGFDDVAGALSPDGSLLAYQSNESGRWEVYLLRLADKRRIAVSAGGGTAPSWSSDGRALFYTSGARVLRSSIDAAGTVSPATPVTTLAPHAHMIGLSPDGRIAFAQGGRAYATHAVLTLESLRELQQLLGPPGPALPR